jgi:peptidoglycan-associated lipoprotein
VSLFKQALRYSSILVLAVALSSCGSKKTATDKAGEGDAGSAAAPKIESTAMNFDPQGSDSGKIDGLKTVHFEFDKANLKEEEKKKIQGNVEWMKSHSGVAVQIEGHCDAKGSIEYNLALGERRAKAVKDYMVHMGVAENKLSIISYGKEKPVANGDSEADYSKNRRANFAPLSQ